MEVIKNVKNAFYVVTLLLLFLNCSTAQKLQKTNPVEFGEVYYQQWVAGVKGGGSGVNIYIPIKSNNNHIVLDSVFFREKVSKLEKINESLVVGRFKSSVNQQKDLILSSNPKDEYGNQVEKSVQDFPFELKSNQCVISYIEDFKTKYIMMDNILKKTLLAYPSAPQKKD